MEQARSSLSVPEPAFISSRISKALETGNVCVGFEETHLMAKPDLNRLEDSHFWGLRRALARTAAVQHVLWVLPQAPLGALCKNSGGQGPPKTRQNGEC